MFNLACNRMITMHRGDYGHFELKVLDLGTTTSPEPYTMTENDTLFIGVMEPGQIFECGLIRKTYTSADFVDGVLTVEFQPSDTLCLLPGTYYYEIKLQCLDADTKNLVQGGVRPSKVYTIQPRTKFIILE